MSKYLYIEKKMTKLHIQDNLSRPRLNDETHAKINMVMIVDIFSSLNISKYFVQQKNPIKIEQNIYKWSKKSSNCKNINCNSFNELVMLKEIIRDDKLFDKINMGILPNRTIVIDNGHILNMLYLRISNRKMYKLYMREFKHRKHNWNYIAFVIKNGRDPRNEFENKLLKELPFVLKQSQAECIVLDYKKYRTPTLLKKEIKDKILYYFNKIDETVTLR